MDRSGISNARKSTFSHPSSCVVAGQNKNGDIAVYSDLMDDGPVAVFTQGEWAAFVEGVKAGQFDLDADGKLVPQPAAETAAAG